MRESTLRQYTYYVPRLAGLRLCGKDDTSKRVEDRRPRRVREDAPRPPKGLQNVSVLYLPKEVYSEIREYRGTIPHQDTVEKTFKEAGLQIKYFRKWWRQKLKQLGIDSEDIEADRKSVV